MERLINFNMNILNIHIIYITIIILILFKSFQYKKKNLENKPTIEYYEWKRIYYKMMVLHKLKYNYLPTKHKWINHINSKSAFF